MKYVRLGIILIFELEWFSIRLDNWWSDLMERYLVD